MSSPSPRKAGFPRRLLKASIRLALKCIAPQMSPGDP
jgi:hypothetical protein